jgi:hypothetical protein
MANSNQPSLFDAETFTTPQDPAEPVEFVYQRTDLTKVEVRRSKRAKRNVTAYRDNEKTVVTVPTRMAKRLSKKYLAQDLFDTHVVPVSIRWVTNQNARWGSCTPGEGTIRLSHRMVRMPPYVIDSVIVHELIHLLIADHSEAFYSLMNKYPEHEKAKAYLDGFSHAQQNYLPE